MAHTTPSPSEEQIYRPQRLWRSRMLPVRGLQYHLREWLPPHGAGIQPPVLLLHGWMDVAASWQFVVDALDGDFVRQRRIVAPDWRGFGLSRLEQARDHHDFYEYLADLDQLIDHLVPDGQAVDLVGHSMGGNVVMMYAGVRAQRVRRLVNLEGFGSPAGEAQKAPARYARWMDEVRALRQGRMQLRSYDDVQAVAARLTKTNPRLTAHKALWLAHHWAAPNAQGRWEILGDAAHKVTSARIWRLDEALALYRAIEAPVLSVQASSDSLQQWWGGRYTLDEYHQRIAHIARCQSAVVPDCGHMLHHDQPEAVAGLIENFLEAA